MHVVGPLEIGKPLEIVATGTNGQIVPGSTPAMTEYGLSLIWIDPQVLPGQCSPGALGELDELVANPEAGTLLTPAELSEHVSGPFAVSFPATPTSRGLRDMCLHAVPHGPRAAALALDIEPRV